MKTEQQEQAQDLYFNTSLSKTEIAARVGVNRRTVLLWCQQGNWDKLRASARHMPAIIAEKCYYLLNAFADSLLREGIANVNFTLKHAQTINLMCTSIKKLKNRSAINESMEMFGFFMDGLKRRNPELAEQVKPEIEQYILVRENQDSNDFLLDGFNPDTTMPYPEAEIREQFEDEADNQQIMKEFAEYVKQRDTAPLPATTLLPAQPPETHTLSCTAGSSLHNDPTHIINLPRDKNEIQSPHDNDVTT